MYVIPPAGDFLQHGRSIDAFVNAAKNGDLAYVTEFVKKYKVFINSTKSDGTALRAAVDQGHTEIVRFLLEHGAKPSLHPKKLFSPLAIAVKKGNIEIAELLLSSGADMKDVGGPSDQSILNMAVLSDKPEMIDLVLDRGFDIHTRVGNGYTAFMYAAEFGKIEVMEKLLARGARADDKDYTGYGALMYISSVILEDQASATIDFLVGKGIDVNAKNNRGQTVLMMFAESGGMDIVQKLVEVGADALLHDRDGLDARDYAVQHGYHEISSFLEVTSSRQIKEAAKAFHRGLPRPMCIPKYKIKKAACPSRG